MNGIGVSPGIAVGQVYIKKDEVRINKYSINNVEAEISRFQEALIASRDQIRELAESAKGVVGEEEAKIFTTHLSMLDDPEYLGHVPDKIKNCGINAEWAVKEATDHLVNLFKKMDSSYLREREADLRDIGNRIINNLLGMQAQNYADLTEHAIIIAGDLLPSDMVHMPKDKVLGFITEKGSSTSHTAIMARTLELPAIVGTKNVMGLVKEGDMMVMDGDRGEFIINPPKHTLAAFQERKTKFDAVKKEERALIGCRTVSQDGYQVEVGCNIGSPEDLPYVLQNDGEGIGLYRSEIIYMHSPSLPTENEQFEAYKAVLEGMQGKPVIIRTLDIGGDKDIPYLNLPKENNPFLGLRGIRYCLAEKKILMTQLRALLRAGCFGLLKIMFPMISSVHEVRAAKKALDEAKEELKEEGLAYNENIEVGIMIEVPAAALLADKLALEVDFFSIGMNDLIQYTLAVDRMNETIAPLYTPFHPALLRLVKMIIDRGHEAGIKVAMCGEAARDVNLIPVLLGMGLDEFSVNPSSVLATRKIINSLNKQEMSKHLDKILDFPDSESVLKYIQENIVMKQ